MNVLILVGGQDTGGQGYRIVEAFRRHSDWDVRSMAKPGPFLYPTDLPYRRNAMDGLYQWADIIHVRNRFENYDYLAANYGPKPVIVHEHGTIFRSDPNRFIREAEERGALMVVSTLDLWLLNPGAEWLPAPYSVDDLRAMRNHHGTDRIVIAHAPSNREVKSTQQFLEAVHQLQDEGFPIDVDLIEHRPWSECLERKAKADIYYDQVILGYGCNALEAWGMGIPVIAGAADETLDEMERRFGRLPFYHATIETIYDAIREMVEDPELRMRYGRIGHDYVRKYHDYPVVVEQLKRVYTQSREAA